MNKTIAGSLIALSLILLGVAVTVHNSGSAGSVKPLAVDFVVSDARDAGPGSLRDAILAADRAGRHIHIVLSVPRVAIESALPALINSHGIDIDAAPGSGIIDAAAAASGAALQIESPASALRGLHIVNAHVAGIVVNAPGVQLDSITVTDSKIGILLTGAARGCAIRTSVFERNDTGVTAEADARDISIFGSIFRGNSRAGLWFVGAPEKTPSAPAHERLRVIDGVFDANATGVVAGNRFLSIQHSRFIGSHDSAVMVLSGTLHLEDSEVQRSGGTAISVSGGINVVLSRNSLFDNVAAAIITRDSDVAIDHSTLRHNGLGIVSILSQDSAVPTITDNIVSRTTADAVTLIGGAPVLRRNQIIDNQGAGLRLLDLVSGSGSLKAAPVLEANVVKGNRVDMPAPAIYRLAGTL